MPSSRLAWLLVPCLLLAGPYAHAQVGVAHLCDLPCDTNPPAVPPPMLDLGDQTPVADNLVASDFGASSGPSSAVPGMLGDSYISLTNVAYTVGGNAILTTVPYGGRYKCADNTGPVPTNRVSFQYKHYHNALQGQGLTGGLLTASNGQIDSYTLGVEKAFLDNWASLEVRVPFYGGSLIDPAAGRTAISSPSFGNLSFILKVLWSRSADFAWGGGLGVDVPTASNVSGWDGFQYDQQAVYLAPFVAFLGTPNDDWWYQGVVQFSFASGSNAMSRSALNLPPLSARFHEQDLVFVTLNGGAWLFRNRINGTGLAAITELNYTATLDATQFVTATDGAGGRVVLSNFANHQNVLNLSAGLHRQITRQSNIRVGAVVPLRGASTSNRLARDRFFDAEVSVQYNRTW